MTSQITWNSLLIQPPLIAPRGWDESRERRLRFGLKKFRTEVNQCLHYQSGSRGFPDVNLANSFFFYLSIIVKFLRRIWWSLRNLVFLGGSARCKLDRCNHLVFVCNLQTIAEWVQLLRQPIRAPDQILDISKEFIGPQRRRLSRKTFPATDNDDRAGGFFPQAHKAMTSSLNYESGGGGGPVGCSNH